MGTRSAPLVFLLLAACMATDGMGPAVRDGGAAAPGTAQPAASTSLPAIPRMRPKAPGKTPSAGTAVAQAGGATKKMDSQPAGAAGGATPAAGNSGAALQADSETAASTATTDTGESGAPADGTGTVLPPGVDESFGMPGTMSEPGSPPADPADGFPSGTGADTGSFDTAAELEAELAAMPLPEPDLGIDVESLFDGDVVRYCEAMWRMGEYIGAARRRGEPLKQSIGASVRRIAAEKQLPLDNRLAFSGQVYGRLVYRLEDSHAALTLGAYVHFACLTVRGDKKIVPADPNAERLLNSGLSYCENTAFTRDALNDCIFRELTPIVDRRNG